MNHCNRICCICNNEAIRAAASDLQALGLDVVFEPHYECTHLLLPVPSFPAVAAEIRSILSGCCDDISISGGNLDKLRLHKFKTVDFLKDNLYLARNAAITSRCAIKLVESRLATAVKHKNILILGFGRIGKCLCKDLSVKGAEITVAARKERDLATITALGFQAIPINYASPYAEHADIIFNTVPAMVLSNWTQPEGTLAVELASVPGIHGKHIISAKGLPAKIAPEESGRLIAETFVRLSL